MDVERKLKLLNTYESYWLMLPSEIQEYIVVFKTSHDVVRHVEEYQKAQICHEIAQYYQLKVAWGLGPICCKIFKCKCDRSKCQDAMHVRICGTYYDVGNVKKSSFWVTRCLELYNESIMSNRFCNFFQNKNMNVRIKLLLMKHYVSYWNMLPEEMQLLILSYRDGQARVDMRRSAASKRM